MSHRIVTFLTASLGITALASRATGQAPAADPLSSGGAATQQAGAPQGPESSTAPRDAGVPILRLHLGDAPQAPQGGQNPAPNVPSVAPEVNVNLGGWMRVDYGYGNRFGPAAGRDELGISKAALVTTATHENFDFTAVLGATILSDIPVVDTSFKDLFVTWHDTSGTGGSVKAGAQPLLFGLKPNGYPGDRTIVPSIEYGGAGGFPVSNQAGPSITGEYPLCDHCKLQGGLFDTSATTFGTPGVNVEGSRLYKNFFGQLRIDGLGVEGLRGLIGAEGRYVGGTDNNIEPIVDVGVGYGNKQFDASLEYIMLDKNITGTADDETYIVAEVTAFLNDRWRLLGDYSVADELDVSTVRLGVVHDINKHVELHVEFAHDDFDTGTDLDSGHVRMTFHF